MNHMLSIFRKYRESRMQNPSLLEAILWRTLYYANIRKAGWKRKKAAVFL